ncbi:MAG: hypothetical protein IKS70_00580 [Bacteroides sp.]|nr:hypothetical protein [Bacteroides sp.]
MHYATRKDGPDGRWSGNTYLTGSIQNKFLEIGMRLEELDHPLPGHEDEKGWGVPNIYVKGRHAFVEATAGDFYEQFGSGMLLRSYEDRSLGIDNSIRGGRLVLTPARWVTIKALGGQQRNYFDRKDRVFNPERGYLWGGDVELGASQWFKAMNDNGWHLNAGASWITKHESPDPITQVIDGKPYRLNQPENVSALSARLRLQHGNWDVYTEYAHKFDDPNATNNYIYRSGSAAMLTATYARSGMSLLLGARRSENFDFRSERTATQNAMRINHLQPFTQQQSYTLAALYPYATQPGGEWALQAEMRYRFKKGSWAGGKYGTGIKLSASYIRGLKKKWNNPQWESNPYDASMMGTDGYESRFFGMGEKYFHDIDLEISKKISPAYSFTFTYMNQYYNRRIIEGHAENGDVIRSNLFIYDGKHKLSQRLSLRTELQYLHTRQAEKDWLFALVECSVLPRFIFSVSDQWNAGVTDKHYYMVSAAGMFGNHRLQLSYGRTRRGINCSGGVCRMMPATEGVYLSYNLNF